jgi:CheY-like chemotaxis protein
MSDLGHDTITDVPVEQLIRAADFFQHLPEPALAFDGRNKLLACNRAAADLHGLRPADAAGSDLFPLFPPEAAHLLARAVEAVRTAGGWKGELPILAAGYHVRTADVRMAAIGECVVMVYEDVTDHGAAHVTREAVRWSAIRDAALAAIESLPAPLPAWAEQVRRFAVGAAAAVDSPIDRGAGRTVLLVGFGPLVRTVLEAFLERCAYLTVAAEHPTEAVDLLRQHRDRVRAVVLGPNAPADALEDLHRTRPLLPAVAVGGDHPAATRLAYPAEPTALIRAVAEAVADDQLNDALTVSTVVDQTVARPNFIVS